MILFASHFTDIMAETVHEAESHLPMIGTTGLGFAVIMLVFLLFIWILSQKAQKWGIEQFKFPFGFQMTFGTTLERVNHTLESDSMIVDGITDTVKQLECYACQRMRQIMTHCISKYLTQYPQYKEHIMRSRLPITHIISDNHIASWLTPKKLDTYIHEKQHQVIVSIESVSGMEQDPHAILVVKKLVHDFIFNVLPVQSYLCEEKIRVYSKSLEMLQFSYNKLRSQYRIEKNKRYMENIETVIDEVYTDSKSQKAELQSSPSYRTAIAASIATDLTRSGEVNMLSGETLMNEHLSFMQQAINGHGLSRTTLNFGTVGKLSSMIDSSEIVLPNGVMIKDRRKAQNEKRTTNEK